MYRAVNISKHFGGVTALEGVNIEIRPGEVHGLLGANGAGKSTLVKILVGAEHPSAGELTLNGELARFGNVGEAATNGVAIVSQELNLFPELDVLENLFLQREPLVARTLTSKAEMRRRAASVLEEVGFGAAPDGPVGRLSLAEQQLVEVARALLQQPRILFLDEPTSALRRREVSRLLDVVSRLRARGVGIVYVSHFLEEVFGVADAVTILRNGRVAVARRPSRELTTSEAVAEMLGHAGEADRVRSRLEKRVAPKPNQRAVALRGVGVRGRMAPVDLVARGGEVVGLAGLEGAGQQTVFDLLFGRQRSDTGRISLPGDVRTPRSACAAVRRRVAFVPADRKRFGLMLDKPVYENLAMVRAGPQGRMGFFLRRSKLIDRAVRRRKELSIRMPSPKVPAGELSGGNQQKLVLAKWLEADPEVFLFDDPTRGVDIGAKAEIHRIIRELSKAGRVILVSSSDLEEMADLCDRVVVFFQGEVRGEMEGDKLTERLLLEAVSAGRIPQAESSGSESLPAW